ncbi:hypothetical protein BU17DRAFT_63137 [Hysterangium stoloniferum]|nr:hypothetical protein BU17DRAFT_63137 [Hysterangium stoloniferum]
MMVGPLSAPSSRSASPATTTASDHHANKTIDDLTLALSNFSKTRAPTPDAHIACCCRRRECPSLVAWSDVRAKLESRLVLSAEVGQALLQRYEAYIRRQDAVLSRQASEASFSETSDLPDDARLQIELLKRKLDIVTEENSIMESRIQELLIKTELSDSTTKMLQRELHDARTTAHRLSAQQTRSVGWESRYTQAVQERDDMRQERDAALAAVRNTEIKVRSGTEKASKLQREIHSLKNDLSSLRASREDFSKSVLQEAKLRLEGLHQSLNTPLPTPHLETARVLEALVADNEALKRDVAELSVLLGEARDELEEARRNELEDVDHDETKVNFTIAGLEDDLKEDALSLGFAIQRQTRGVQTDLLPSPPSQPAHNTNTHHAFALPSPGPSSLGIDSLSSRSETSSLSGPEHTRPSTANLTPSTSKLDTGFAPAPTPATTNRHLILPTDPHPITTMTSSLAPLLTRLTQADPRTLTLRLKRQNLNADARHVGRATIKGVVAEVGRMRVGRTSGGVGAVGGARRGAEWSAVATREEMKALLRLMRDLFSTVGALREQLNEVVFEPEVAGQMRKEAFHGDEGGSWMPAISRLLFKQPTSLSNPTTSSSSTHAAAPHASANAITLRDHVSSPPLLHPQPRAAAQVSASAMTVNVLAGSTSIHGFMSADDIVRTTSPKAIQPPQTPLPMEQGRLRGLFVGAPGSGVGVAERGREKGGGGWVVLPRGLGASTSENDKEKRALRNVSVGAGVKRATSVKAKLRSNVVVLDDAPPPPLPTTDFRETLLQRTLRPRGLSDSSIHTTFLKAGEDAVDADGEHERGQSDDSQIHARNGSGGGGSGAATPRKGKDFSGIGIGIGIRRGGSPSISSASAVSSSPPRGASVRVPRVERLATWAQFGDGAGVRFGSPREDGGVHAAWKRRGDI